MSAMGRSEEIRDVPIFITTIDIRDFALQLLNKNIFPKLQLEVAHFLKIKLRKSYRVHSRIDHPEFYTPKSF